MAVTTLSEQLRALRKKTRKKATRKKTRKKATRKKTRKKATRKRTPAELRALRLRNLAKARRAKKALAR